MKTYYYYYRDEDDVPKVTVCLLKDGNEIGKGVAVCSPLDFPNKKEGRKIARGFARKALGMKRSSVHILREETIEIIEDCVNSNMEENTDFCHSVYQPALTKFENKIVNYRK